MRSISDIRRKAHYELDLLRYASEKRRVDGHGIPKALLHQFGICVIVKNEGRYIAEWLRYHQVAGVDVVYLYDNGSTDDTAERIRPFVESGFVEYTAFPGAGRQLDAYNDCLPRHRWDCKYIAFIDADEFLFKMDADADLVGIVDSIMGLDPNAGGVAVNWRMFGSSGLEHMPTRGGVLDSYLWRASEGMASNRCIKTVVDPRRAFEFHHVHYPKYFEPYHSISETGERVDGWEYRNDHIEKLRVNHYFTKSKDEWVERRSLGMADFSNRKRGLDEFYAHDKNDIYDNSMLPYVEVMGKGFESYGHGSEGDKQS